jgi:2-aminoadipate transaminase
MALLREALKEKVAFVPGAPFYPKGGGQESMRLNFSYCPPDVIDEGIRRLSRVMERAIAQGR